MTLQERIAVGTSGEAERVVTPEITVKHHYPEMPAVLGTPFMIYLMEVAATKAIAALLPPGWVSVGVDVNIRHLAATPVGKRVTATARVTGFADKLVAFAVEARDEDRLIGSGTHTRAPVELARFEKRRGG